MGVLIAILLGTVLALALPQWFVWMQPVLQPAFAVTMLFVGTLVRAEQLRAFSRKSSWVLAGLLTQYTVMPLTAWVVSLAFDDPLIRVGIVLVGCMPGAMASNVMTLLYRGDLILSVAMTTLATLICPLTLAFWLPLLADRRIEVPAWGLAWNATWMVVLPVATGILLRYLKTQMPGWWDRVATLLASATIVFIILVVVATNHARLTEIGPKLALGMLALNLGGYALAYVAAKLLGWPAVQRRTLVIEVGMQNAGLGSVLAIAHLGQAGAVPSAFYTALCVFTVSLALPLRQRGASQLAPQSSLLDGPAAKIPD